MVAHFRPYRLLLPPSRPPPAPHSHTHNSLTHTTYSHTHNSLIHNSLTQLTRTQLSHTQLTHTHTTLSHTTYSHTHTTLSHTTYSDTTLSHTQLTHTHTQLSLTHTTLSHTTYSHTTLSRTQFSHPLGAWRHRPALWRLVPVCRPGRSGCLRGRRSAWRHHHRQFCVAGMALGGHFWLWAGSGGTLGPRLSPWTPRLFVWQAWHVETSASILCGRCGTWQHRPSLCVAGLALVALGWLWRRAWFPSVAVHAAAVCVAGMALGDIDLHFVWQAWHFWHSAGSGGALGSRLSPWTPWLFVWQAWRLATSTFILCGRRWHLWLLAGSGGALGSCLAPWTPRLCVWQAWHLEASTSILCGRRRTSRHRPALCVAGVTLWHWAGSGGAENLGVEVTRCL